MKQFTFEFLLLSSEISHVGNKIAKQYPGCFLFSKYLSLETLDFQIEPEVQPKQELCLTACDTMCREGGHFHACYPLLSEPLKS